MKSQFSDAQLQHIVDQGTIYMCACPAQVARAMQDLRSLYDYQTCCLETVSNDARVHHEIACAVVKAHDVMQECLNRVIDLEGWDRTTLDMPEGLRQRQVKEAGLLNGPCERGA